MDLVIKTSLSAAVKALAADQPEDALDALANGLDRARAKEDLEGEMLVYGLLAPTFEKTGNRKKALKCAQKALKLAQTHGDDEGRAHYQSLVDQFSGEAEEPTSESPARPLTETEVNLAFSRAEQALTMGEANAAIGILTPLIASADQSGDKEVEASAAGMLAQAYLMAGYGEKAWELARHALVIAKGLGDESAISHFQRLADSLASHDGTRAQSLLAEQHLAAKIQEVCHRAGEALTDEKYEDAIALLEPIVTEAKAAGIAESEATARGLLAQALLASERKKEAAEHAARALEIAEQVGDETAIQHFKDLHKLAAGWLASQGEG